jgi:hypothetical protein
VPTSRTPKRLPKIAAADARFGRALKAWMLFELRSAEPQLLDVQTWNSIESQHIGRVYAELGFLPDRQWREYKADVGELVRRLKAA